MPEFEIGFSPCPNDTFIFDALVNRRINVNGFQFETYISDVEDLNRKAFITELDVSKLSFGTYLKLVKDYILLDSGSALGHNCGPLLIAKTEYSLDDLPNLRIAIPGIHTTANLLLGFASPLSKNITEMLFSDIEQAVLDDRVDVGLIIHESRFTYAQKGLKKLADLGEFWEGSTGFPIPLGGIFVKRSIGRERIRKINKLIRESIEFAYANPTEGWSYIKNWAQETADDVIRKHIDLYVNDYSISLGKEGRNAIEVLFAKAKEAGIADLSGDLFYIP